MHKLFFVASAIIAFTSSQSLAERPTLSSSCTISNGAGTYLLCPSGTIYYASASDVGAWSVFATLPVPIADVAHWSGRAIALSGGEVRWTDGSSWTVRASLPVPSDEVASWDNNLLITTAGAAWYYSGAVDQWIRTGDLPCAAPVATSSSNIGSVKALYR